MQSQRRKKARVSSNSLCYLPEYCRKSVYLPQYSGITTPPEQYFSMKMFILMAKVLFGAGMVDMRGKVNGWVYQKNKFGAMVRVKVSPTQTLTPARSGIRSVFSSLSQSWKTTLSAGQRAGWRALAAELPQTDVFGNRYFMNGNNLFISCNMNLYMLGEDAILDPPSDNFVPAQLSFSVEFVTGVLKVLYAPTIPNAPVTCAALLFASAQVSPGINVPPSKMPFIGFLPGGEASPSDAIDTMWTARYGDYVDGKSIWVKMVQIRTDFGFQAQPFVASTLVTL